MEKLADGRAVGAWHPDAGVQFAGRNSRRRWWLTSPVHQGDHGGAVNTIAQEMPGDSGEPVVTTLVCFVLFCMRGCGCIMRPAFPAPSVIGGDGRFMHNPGEGAPRECEGVPSDRSGSGSQTSSA